MSDVTLYHGDCLVEMNKIPDGSVDLIVTSPPYYNARSYSHFKSYQDYLAFLSLFAKQASRVLKPSCILAINLSCVIEPRQGRQSESVRRPIPFDFMPLAQSHGFKFLDDIIWQKPDGASSRAIKFSHHRRPVAYKPFQVTEYILVFKKGDGLLDRVIRRHSSDTIAQSLVGDGYERTNVWRINPATNGKHPAPFPLDLVQKLVGYYSFVNDLVLDSFVGSGTTGVACLNTGRRFIGIELDEGYFQIAKERIERVQAETWQPELLSEATV